MMEGTETWADRMTWTEGERCVEEDDRHADPELRKAVVMRQQLGCSGYTVVDVRDEEEREERESKLFGFDDEPDMASAIAKIGTFILDAVDDPHSEDDNDIGLIVQVDDTALTAQNMIVEVMGASSVFELRRIADTYQDVPGAEALTEACEQALKFYSELKRVG